MQSFYAPDKGAKLTILVIYTILFIHTCEHIFEQMNASWFRFSIRGVLLPTDIPWYQVLPSSMQEQTYMFSLYWLFVHELSKWKILIYIVGVFFVLVGMRMPVAYPLSIVALIVTLASDTIRFLIVFLGYFNCRNTFLCRLQTSPYPIPDDTLGTNKNPYYVWVVWMQGAQLITGLALVSLILGLKYIITLLVPNEAMEGAHQVGGEGENSNSVSRPLKREAIGDGSRTLEINVTRSRLRKPHRTADRKPRVRIGNLLFGEVSVEH